MAPSQTKARRGKLPRWGVPPKPPLGWGGCAPPGPPALASSVSVHGSSVSCVYVCASLACVFMACCRCNRSGSCQNCRCVKNGSLCHGCLPQRLGKCVNTVYSPPSQACDETTLLPQSIHNSSPRLHSSSRLSPLDTTANSPCSTSGSQPEAPSMRSPGSHPHTCDPVSLPPSLTTTESSPELPNCMPVADPMFTWGCHESTTFITSLNVAYNEVVHWRPNLFRVPYGKVGKSFVSELAKLYNSFASKSAMECIAMKAAVVLPILMLQKPSSKSKAKEHNSCLERRLNTWLDGDLDNLLFEGRTLQQRIPKSVLEENSKRHKRHARSFTNLMFEGKTKAAIRLLTEESKGGFLRLCDEVDSTHTVKDILIEKHPPGQPAHADSIDCNAKPPEVHPVLFDSIDASLIRSAALRTYGAAGPSGLDAVCWRRLCTSFKAASQSLCQSLANTARRLCTDIVDPSITAPLFACRLIALNKNPGVRPIGIGDTA